MSKIIFTFSRRLIIYSPMVLGWGGHTYDMKVFTCIWNRLASHGYSIFFPMTSIIIPCTCVSFFYIRIYVFVKKSKARVFEASSSPLSKIEAKKAIYFTKSIFISFITLFVCW